MIKAFRSLLPLLMMLCIEVTYAAVDTSKLPSDWETASPPAQFQAYAAQTGLVLREYRTNPASKAILLHLTATIQGNAQELAAGMLDSLNSQQSQAGYTIRLNKIEPISGGDVLQQAWQYGNTVEIRLCELSENPVHQIRMSGPAENYSHLLAAAQSVFVYPRNDVQSEAYRAGHHAGYQAGYIIGQFLGWVFLAALVVIIIARLRRKLDREKPIAASSGFSIEKLKATKAPVIREVEQGGTGQSATRTESKSEDVDKPQPETEGRSL